MTNDDAIKKIIDTYLKECIETGMNKQPGIIEVEMADPNCPPGKESQAWLPIDSTVTNAEIELFETQIGHKLPGNYKVLLKHKHFYELFIAEVTFCKHPVNKWRKALYDMVVNHWPTEELFDKGYLQFADWSDWGALCFDTNRQTTNNDYPIVLWDHDGPVAIQDVAENFFSLLIKLDKEHKRMAQGYQE